MGCCAEKRGQAACILVQHGGWPSVQYIKVIYDMDFEAVYYINMA